MAKTTIVSIVGVTLLLGLLLSCGTLGLAVREGVMSEVLVRFPPQSRYQFILRVGNDALPWDRSSRRPAAINLWAHGQGTDWHIIRLVRVPLGEPVERHEQ